MKKYWQLVRLQLLLQFSAIRPQNLRAELKAHKGRAAGRVLGVTILVLWAAAVMTWIEWKVLDVLIALSMPHLLLGLTAMIGMVLTLFSGIFYVMSTLYFSKDTTLLAALPIREHQLFAARLTRVWVGEVGIATLFVLPSVILYMIRLGFDAALLARAVLVILFSPVLPLCVAALLSSLLARLSAFRRHREAVTTLGSILVMLLSVAFSMSISMMSTSLEEDSELLVNLLTGRQDLLDRLGGIFPPAGWAAQGLVGHTDLLLLLLAVSIAAAALIVWIFGHGYLRACSAEGEGEGSRRVVDLGKVQYRSTRPLWAVFRREMQEVLRTPVYLLNCVLSSVLMPLIMVVGMGVGLAQGFGTDVMSAVNELLGDLEGIDLTLVGVVLTALLSYMAGMNAASATSVSREGKRHGLYRMMPVDARLFLRGKMLSGLVFSFVGVMIACAALWIMLPALSLQIGEALLWSGLLAVLFSDIGVLIDTMHPRLTWANETQAVKQNFNMVVSMLIGFGVLALLGLGTWWMFSHGHGGTLYIAVLTGVLLLLCAVGELLLFRLGTQKYLAIEA